MQQVKSREVCLARYIDPNGPPKPEDFEFVTREVSGPAPGDVLVRNIWMTVAPGMRGALTNRPGERFEPHPLHTTTLRSQAIGQVIETASGDLSVGDYVYSNLGFREYYTAKPGDLRKIDPKRAPVQAHLGVLSGNGHTAYVGMLHVAAPVKAGETVFVSAAAGSVGSLAAQIAKLKGARVIGSAGSDEKCDWLTREAGLDAAINYRTAGDLTAALKAAAPEGIDFYFENVGGEHLIAALNTMKTYGRIVVCGLIDRYNAKGVTPPHNIVQVLYKRLTIKGFLQNDYDHLDIPWEREMAEWLNSGKLKNAETVLEGIENAPNAYIGIFTGANLGKMLVKLGPDPAI